MTAGRKIIKMKNLSEMFEFLNNCGNEMILTEIKNHGQRLIRDHGAQSTTKFKLDIEKINTLLRLSEWYLMEEFNKEKEGKTGVVNLLRK